ncbi:hypothetical protein BDZ94DRAFT_194618 [Collybia nuda]|uniref:Uncharacterized protein n=1 Tax=Collybia nuda TaxID=64659 RepID=A0A9P6CE46_9AGAR|nr:hypothetical protein BDZ94DRAFT_194618 [Collybia nuda]
MKNRPQPLYQPHPFSSPIRPRSLNQSRPFSSPIHPQPQTWSRNLQYYGNSADHHPNAGIFSSPIRPSHDNLTSIKERPIRFKPRIPFPAPPPRLLSPPFTHRTSTGSVTNNNIKKKSQSPRKSIDCNSKFIPTPGTNRNHLPQFLRCNQAFPENYGEIPYLSPQTSRYEDFADGRLPQSDSSTHGGRSSYDYQPHEPFIQKPGGRTYTIKTEHYSPSNETSTTHIANNFGKPQVADHVLLKRSQSPPKNHRTPPRKRIDANAYADQNPDEEWSTLPPRKKHKLT